jgi:hypothetical protein
MLKSIEVIQNSLVLEVKDWATFTSYNDDRRVYFNMRKNLMLALSEAQSLEDYIDETGTLQNIIAQGLHQRHNELQKLEKSLRERSMIQ